MSPEPALPPGPPLRRRGLRSLGYYARFAIDPIGFVGERFATYGDAYFAPSEDGGLFVLRHPDHLHDVLVANASSFAKTHTAFQALGRVLGEGLLTSDGDTWKRQRRLVQPAFTPARLARYAAVMTDESERTVDELLREGEGDVGAAMTEATLRIVGRALFGRDVGGDTDDVAGAMRVFQTSLTQVDILPQWVPFPPRARLATALGTLDRIVFGLIEKRRAEGGEAGDDLLSMLVAATDDEGGGAKLTEREVRDQLVTLFLAGHETTANALTWTLYLLGRTPAVKRTLVAEVDRVLAGRAATYEDLPNLPYTRAVVDEGMRLYPPVFAIARQARAATTIGPYAVAAGTEVMLWPYFTHRDARFWPDPLAFEPARFLEEAKDRPRLAYLPFGAGPRACIGRSFAAIEAQILLATVMAKVDLVPTSDAEIAAKPRITLCPSRAVRMRATKR
jgi:cytochrome P450